VEEHENEYAQLTQFNFVFINIKVLYLIYTKFIYTRVQPT